MLPGPSTTEGTPILPNLLASEPNPTAESCPPPRTARQAASAARAVVLSGGVSSGGSTRYGSSRTMWNSGCSLECPRDEGIDLGKDRVRLLARHQPAVNLDGARIGHHVDLQSAVNDADRHERRTGHRMRPGRQTGFDLCPQPVDHLDHLVDRIVALGRARGVRGLPDGADVPPETALVHDDRRQAGRLADHRTVQGWPGSHVGVDAARPVLLVDRAEEHQVVSQARHERRSAG